MCKHQTKQQFLLKLEAAQIANSLPDDQDLQKVTGLTVEDFDNNPTAIKSAYEFGMNFLFQAGDSFAIRCTLFSNLNLPQQLVVEN
jgi:hypothetical protein